MKCVIPGVGNLTAERSLSLLRFLRFYAKQFNMDILEISNIFISANTVHMVSLKNERNHIQARLI